MATKIILPKLGFSMNEAVLNAWLSKDGDEVIEGQPLFAIESDKAVEEIESPSSGTLRIIAEVGATYPVGHVLGEIG
jgi:pyruvate/2-oxoglutarate dehydrogenase complex dihydrolipoamide acyltransferase (E2) component